MFHVHPHNEIGFLSATTVPECVVNGHGYVSPISLKCYVTDVGSHGEIVDITKKVSKTCFAFGRKLRVNGAKRV